VIAVADPCSALERKVRERLRDDESHRRIAQVLAEVAAAAIHPARHLGVGRSASHGMLEDSVERATRAAVETLITHLDDLVESLPRVTRDDLANQQVMAELGLE
jgi:hypothetical protein